MRILRSFSVQILFDLRCADFRRSRQADYLNALVAPDIKLPFPVVSHGKDVDVVFVHVGLFLIPVLLRDHEIDIPDGLQQVLSLLIRKVALFLLLRPIELIRRRRDDEVIPRLLRAAQEVDMSVV